MLIYEYDNVEVVNNAKSANIMCRNEDNMKR